MVFFVFIGKGSSSISSDLSSSTDQTSTKAPKNAATSEGRAYGPHYPSLVCVSFFFFLFFCAVLTIFGKKCVLEVLYTENKLVSLHCSEKGGAPPHHHSPFWKTQALSNRERGPDPWRCLGDRAPQGKIVCLGGREKKRERGGGKEDMQWGSLFLQGCLFEGLPQVFLWTDELVWITHKIAAHPQRSTIKWKQL